MKKTIGVFVILFALCWLFMGYYESLDDARIKYNLFIKHHPSLQIRFENIFANSQDPKSLKQLSERERQLVMDYCRFRLGINTQLSTQEELERCEAR